MAAKNIRKSPFRHLFGKPFQQADIFREVLHGSLSVDANPLKANGTYFAVPYTVNGSICVVNMHEQKGALDHEALPIFYHDDKQQCLDFEFSPHNDNLIASVHQDGAVKLWRIPDGGLKESTSTAAANFAHEKRALNVSWHPHAENILTTVDAGKTGIVWDVAAAKEALKLPAVHKGLVVSLTWGEGGSLLGTLAKDKKLRVIDVRSQECTGEVEAHSGAKAGKALWLGNKDQLLTVGFTRTRQREAKLWDPRKLTDPLSTNLIDQGSSASIFPIYDNDLSLLYLAGKGEGNIRMFDVEDGNLFQVAQHKDLDPSAGLAALPKSAVNVMGCEVLRILRLTPKNHVIPVRFEVPRSDSHFFQEDLYPDTWDGKPSVSSAQWLAGENGSISKVSLKPADA